MADLEGALAELGIEVASVSGKEYWAHCPGHAARTGKPDNKPSWSINGESLAHHCFSCGYSGNLVTLYRDLIGKAPDNLEWELAKQGVLRAMEPTAKMDEGPKVSEWTLKQFVDVPDRLLQHRYLQRESVDFYGVRWDPEGKCWVIPIRDPNGVLLGYQYRQKGNVINYPPGMKKSTTLFGAHLYFPENIARITVVESPLDAVRFHGIGVDAVSTFGAAFSEEQVTLLARHFRLVVVAYDNDGPGIKANFYLRKALQKLGVVAIEFDYSGLAAKDPGDVQSDEALLKAWRTSNSFGLIPS
jgi:DNA primase